MRLVYAEPVRGGGIASYLACIAASKEGRKSNMVHGCTLLIASAALALVCGGVVLPPLVMHKERIFAASGKPSAAQNDYKMVHIQHNVLNLQRTIGSIC